jgi:hypothetical protein
MAAPIAAGIYTIARYGAKYGLQKARKKYGQAGIDKLLNSKAYKNFLKREEKGKFFDSAGNPRYLPHIVGIMGGGSTAVAVKGYSDLKKYEKKSGLTKTPVKSAPQPKKKKTLLSLTGNVAQSQGKQYGGPVRKAKY